MGFSNRAASKFGFNRSDDSTPVNVLGGLGTAYNITYADDLTSGRNLDLTWSRETISSIPVVLYFNGHSFSRSDRSKAEGLCGVIAHRGKFVANVGFRDLKHGITVRDSLTDAIKAVEWLRSRQDTYNIDMSDIVVTGSSYGALMALWLTMYLNGNRLAEELGVEKPPVHVSGLGLFTGMTDTTSGDVTMRGIADSMRKIGREDKELGEAIDPWNNHDLRMLPPIFQVTSTLDSAEPDVYRLNRLLDINKVAHHTMEFGENSRTVRGFMENHHDSNECARTVSVMFNYFKDNQ